MPEQLTRGRRSRLQWGGVFASLVLFVGALGGLAWRLVSPLPSYTVSTDYSAWTTERGLAAQFGADAWFAAIGLLTGIGLGLVAWRWFHRLGWPVALIGFTSATAAALICWAMGTLLDPPDFATRLAEAAPGDQVPIDLELSAYSALAVWPTGAMLVILLASALMPDPEDPGSRRLSTGDKDEQADQDGRVLRASSATSPRSPTRPESASPVSAPESPLPSGQESPAAPHVPPIDSRHDQNP